MIVNLQQLAIDEFGNYESPTLLITTMSDEPICTVVNPETLTADFIFNDVSELKFSVVDKMCIDGKWIDNPCFDELIGMRKIVMEPFGVFVIVNPSISDDGTIRTKEVTCYSYEYALNYKNLPPLNGTFMMHDPTGTSQDTMTNMILECAPDWKIGYVASGLSGKYRTFDCQSQPLFGFLSGDFQTSYGCIVLYDTFNKEINIYDVAADIDTMNLHLDTNNLIKKEDIDEHSDEIVTCLSVYGADDTSIATVNPLGDKIYNLDYFIGLGDIPADVATAWNTWKEKYAIYQRLFSDMFAQYYSNQLLLNTQTSKLVDLEGELSGMNHIMDTYNTDTNGDHSTEKVELVTEIVTKEAEVNAQQTVVDNAVAQIEADKDMLREISELCAFENNFTGEQIEVINVYLREDSLQDSTFVTSNIIDSPTAAFTVETDDPIVVMIDKGNLYQANEYAQLTTAEWTTLSPDAEQAMVINGIENSLSETKFGRHFFNIDTCRCRVESVSGGFSLYGTVVNSTLSYKDEANTDGSHDALITFSFNEPTYDGDEVSYTNALFVATGTITDFQYHNDINTPNVDTMSFKLTSGITTVTADSSIDRRQNVLQELYEYGKQSLNELAFPSYEFKVDSANLFTCNTFEQFRNEIALGRKLYLAFDEDYYLEPILTQVSVDFMDITKLELVFGNTFRANNPEFKLADTIGKTAKTAASLDASKFNYNAFVNSGITNDVEALIKGALDVAKKNIINSVNQDVLIDSQGIHLRKYNPATGLFDPAEVRMINNQIVFTNDAWATAALAIGKIETPDGASTMGIVGQSIIGEVLVGNKLLIEANNPDTNFGGNVTHFRVDAGGVKMANGAINIQGADPHNQIIINPDYGIMAGDSTLFTMGETGFEYNFVDEDGEMIYDEDLYDNYGLEIPTGAKFFFDINTGNLAFRGDIYAENGYFNGDVHAKNLIVSDTATVEGLVVGKNVTMGDNAYISWGQIDSKPNVFSESGGTTYIDGSKILTGSISASQIDTSTLVVGQNISMSPNAVISWNNLPSNVASDGYVASAVSGLVSESQVTTITQYSISTGDLHLCGNIFRSDTSFTESNFLIGQNINNRLQIGSANDGASYSGLSMYGRGDMYFIPQGGTVGQYAMRISSNGRVTIDTLGNDAEAGNVGSYNLVVAGSSGTLYATSTSLNDLTNGSLSITAVFG